MVIIVAGQVIFTPVDSEPQLPAWALTATVVVALIWLASDAFGVADARWDQPLAPYARPDAADDSVHHRVLTSHPAAGEPSPALRNLLVQLARARDPDLTDPELRVLADGSTRKLSPTDIDRYLTRIEQPRDHD
ncbi:hypothetical protein [Nocardioides sp. B-3]|uniref:hypothetical protein n=1 Tax=Nocardioides sp. B-3 TaxID=2895565 RepID=UPI0021530F13|nr:hypothetical protein [Nocardioides sp. B-3]UUZ58174.1 hypothetical protein LP418_18120 [Nocardioides sp. B-3]